MEEIKQTLIIKIKPHPITGKKTIRFGGNYTILTRPAENGRTEFWIPGFEIRIFLKDKTNINQIIKRSLDCYFDTFFKAGFKNPLGKFVTDISRKGFTSISDALVKKELISGKILIDKKPINITFNSEKPLPDAFEVDSSEEIKERELVA